MEKDENKKHYFSVVDGQDKRQLFGTLAVHRMTLEIWEKGAEERNVEQFKILTFDESSLVFKLAPKKKSFFKTLFKGMLANQEVFCKFSLNKIYYFTHSFLSYDIKTQGYSIKFDRDIFLARQREDYRLKASDLVQIQFKVDGKTFDCIDISAGGLSFSFNPDKHPKFKEGVSLKNGQVFLCGKKYFIATAIIIKILPKENKTASAKNTLCAGISFVELPENIEEALSVQVNAEARGEEIKKKFLSNHGDMT